MKPQKTQDCQSNHVQKEHSGRITIPDLKIYYRASNLILAQNLTYRPIEQDRRPKHEY